MSNQWAAQMYDHDDIQGQSSEEAQRKDEPMNKLTPNSYPGYWLDKFNRSKYVPTLTARQKEYWALRLAAFNALSPMGSTKLATWGTTDSKPIDGHEEAQK